MKKVVFREENEDPAIGIPVLAGFYSYLANLSESKQVKFFKVLF